MAERIVVFGATGYTGDLTARALVDRGARPVLAARNEGRVRALAEELGGLEWAVADVARPDSVRALVQRGDVLISTVGPFERWGEPAVQAAIAAGAHYLDSTGEGTFIRAVFERFGARSAGRRVRAADGLRLRLGARQPRRRARAARRGPGRHAGGDRLLQPRRAALRR